MLRTIKKTAMSLAAFSSLIIQLYTIWCSARPLLRTSRIVKLLRFTNNGILGVFAILSILYNN